MIQCEGQMNLMDLLTPVACKEPPMLLSEGQMVYKVVRGDVYERIVEKRTWTCGDNNRGYDLDEGITWNTQIGKVVFADREPAEQVANRYLAENEHILASDIKATEVVAYRYEYMGREIICFYSVLEDENVYFKYGSMYGHIGKKAEIKKFEEDRRQCMELNGGYAVLENYHPQYKNMYKCNQDSWLYGEARYGYIDY